MFITKKQHTRDLDKLQRSYNYAIDNLEHVNRMFSTRIKRLELDLSAIKDFLKVNLITIPEVYKAVLKEDESESN